LKRWSLGALLIAACGLSGAASAGALEECMDKGDHQAVTRCLTVADSAANAALRDAEGRAATMARELDAATGRTEAARAYDRSVRAYSQYRDAQCNYVKAMYASGNGAGQALLACRVDFARRRARELLH
jgi:uncharacterized protein YecT (DUF1311 family)